MVIQRRMVIVEVVRSEIHFLIFLFFKIYLFIIRERERESGGREEGDGEGETGSSQGPRCGTQSWDSVITP